jgi:type II secretory pathway pseudopilin PulG
MNVKIVSAEMKEATHMKKLFSLVEMLVVVSILAVLMTLISPSLSNIVSESSVLSCMNQMKTLGELSSFYINDHDDTYPYPGYENKSGVDPRSISDDTFGITWDDLLSQYDGRDLTLSEMESVTGFNRIVTRGNILESEDYDIPKLYQCPEDDFSRRLWSGHGEPRSYAMNTYYKGDDRNVTTSRSGWGYIQWSKGLGSGKFGQKSSTIEDFAGTIFLAERPSQLNILGKSTDLDLVRPSETHNRNDEYLHPDFALNFLFADMHVANLLLIETHEADKQGSYSEAGKMWTRAID